MTEGEKNSEGLEYRRCRFAAWIPRDRVYTRDHYWMKEAGPGLWRVGLTPWAVRMLGDLVECRWDVGEGAEVRLDEALGMVEGFKAAAEIRAAAAGRLAAVNAELAVNLDAMTRDCYGAGWLYAIAGAREAGVREAGGYREWLDEAVDERRGGVMGDGG